MPYFRNILVGVDLSDSGGSAAPELNRPTQEAVECAIQVAAHLASELTFFTVLELPPQTREILGERFEQTVRAAENEAHGSLGQLVERAKQEGVEAAGRVVFGTAWLEIIRQVVREKHDLVMIGTRNLGAASRLLFGSTGMKLLRNCPCPVWIAKPDTGRDETVMLVASDLSETAQQALHIAIDGGRLLDAKLHLLHAVEFPLERRMWLTGLSDAELEDSRRKTRADAEQMLHEQLSQTDYRTLSYGIQVHVVDGPPDVVISQAIEEFDVNLLVMGTVGRSGIPGLLVGNTAERLLSQVSCSVLTVKPPDFECPIALSG